MDEELVEVVVEVLLGGEGGSATGEGEGEAVEVEAAASVQVGAVPEGVTQTLRELVALVEEGVRFRCTSVWAEGLGSSWRFIVLCTLCTFDLENDIPTVMPRRFELPFFVKDRSMPNSASLALELDEGGQASYRTLQQVGSVDRDARSSRLAFTHMKVWSNF